MKKLEDKKTDVNTKKSFTVNDVKRLLKDIVRIQVSTRHQNIEINDSIANFLKNYKKYGVKNLSKKYKISESNKV